MKKPLIFALALVRSAKRWPALGLVLALVVTFGSGQAPAQSLPANGFKIGMFGFEYKPVLPYTWCEPSVSSGGYKSSQLDVLADDGFNVVQDYSVNWSDQNMDSVLRLVAANKLKILVESKAFYKLDPPKNIPPFGWISFTGQNVYNSGGNSGACQWKARPNYETLINSVYSKSANKDIVWGHEVTEEASYRHCNNHTNDPRPYHCDPGKNPDPDQQVSVD